MNGRAGNFCFARFLKMNKALCFLFCFFFALPLSAAEISDVAQSKAWLALVHYQKTFFGGKKGIIGSENFYLSPEGRHNPQAELEATIALFEGDDEEKQCLFPARYFFLKKQGLVKADFPHCVEYEQFQADLQPSGITFLFTDAYMNNSSSLFGHTLLRVDTKRKGTQLLAHGVNYGAFTKGYENSFLYAIYGLTGMYPGGLTTKPYYDVINTYNNIENRDIWEYQLDLTQEELDFFVAHIWEIGQTQTPYYFFTQNCSYMLMELFDAVRPSLDLRADFPVQTIPLDTIKAVGVREGVVRQTNYRPSRRRKIKHRLTQMNKAQRQALYEALQTEDWAINALSDDEKADVLETAYQYVQYQYIAEDIDLKDYRRKSFGLLKARNQTRAGQKFATLQEGKDPMSAHDAALVAFGLGTQNGDVFEQISLRPAYHSLTDNPFGYLPGAAINFLNLTMRHQDRHDRFYLQKLDVLQLASFSPIDTLFQAPTYRIDLNVSRELKPKTLDPYYALNGSVSGGGTLALSEPLWLYALSSVDGAYGGALARNQCSGVGLSLGALYTGEHVSAQAEVKKIFATSTPGNKFIYQLMLDYHISRNTALETSFQYVQYEHGKNITEPILSLKKFF